MLKTINWLLKLFKVELIAIQFDKELRQSAKEIIAQTDNMIGSGQFKRDQALRALLNRHPEVRERDAALAIELALR